MVVLFLFFLVRRGPGENERRTEGCRCSCDSRPYCKRPSAVESACMSIRGRMTAAGWRRQSSGSCRRELREGQEVGLEVVRKRARVTADCFPPHPSPV